MSFIKRDLSVFQFWGFAFSVLAGTLLHFLYGWTNESILAAPFSSVNESTWEHMKLLFFPTFIFALFEMFFFKDLKNFWCVKFVGILTGLLLIPVLFYTYNGAIGKSPDFVNIAIFFISAAIAFVIETRLFKSTVCKSSKLAFIAICLIALLFVFFTFNPPRLPIFLDPISQTYGI